MNKEKRAFSRIPYMLGLNYTAIENLFSEKPEVSLEGEVMDLSDAGMRMSINELVEVGYLILARVPLPGVNVHLPVIGQVMWRQQHNTKYHVGIRFLKQ